MAFKRRNAVDVNQAEIVGALRDLGATVHITAQEGNGFPDLVVGFQGVNALLEVKPDVTDKRQRNLRQNQKDWHDGWKGQVTVVRSIDEAITAVFAAAHREGKLPIRGRVS